MEDVLFHIPKFYISITGSIICLCYAVYFLNVYYELTNDKLSIRELTDKHSLKLRISKLNTTKRTVWLLVIVTIYFLYLAVRCILDISSW